ncbi:undecaprenyl-diphosphate phosphatase [Chromobacterium sp. S0633]|uniref:undecaprenyl-diphosphate phosphatase n=1 Tax=Chromobacterium sp. S0633 TaxID=2957805 RepID=UPI0020A1C12D|nr:undecaprenyl-diphosphate phosphatase [Chromobacterium sp. S0633]MCP1292340.1 undecaprenyl-diphosphate phosphatase [Chromobacterium sp. S0633]
MNPIEALLFAVIQGVSELFPVSSLGHGVLIPDWLHWSINRMSPDFLPFMVVLHLGTAAALLLYFRRDWLQLTGGFLKAGGKASNPDARLMWLLIAGTIPAGLLGLLLEKQLRALFTSTTAVLIFLSLNGLLLLWGDRLKRKQAHLDLERLSFSGAIKIGAGQALALLPGFSRSGATLVTGLAHGLDYASSARFSFLLATPIIAAAGVLEVPKLAHSQVSAGMLLACGLLSGACAYASTAFLMRYFKKSEIESLRPFGYYCLLVGLGGLLAKLL